MDDVEEQDDTASPPSGNHNDDVMEEQDDTHAAAATASSPSSNNNSSSNGNKKCCQRIFGFNLASLSLLLLLFLIITIITTCVLTYSTNYNTSPVTDWILVGGITSSSATFRIRVNENDAGTKRTLVVSKNQDLTTEEIVWWEDIVDAVASDNSFVVTMDVTGLDSNTQYYYGITTEEENVNTEQRGSFSTAGPEGQPMNFKIAAAGCAMTGSKNDVFDRIAKEDPLLFLHLGDFHYEDINEDDLNVRMNAIDRVLGSSPQANLFRNTGLVYMWDDHDWLGNDSGGSGVGRDAALESYRIGFPYYTPLPAAVDADEEEEASPYHAFTIGTIRFIIMDLRSDASSTSMYSDQQKSWLFDELAAASSDAYDFVILVSTKPWIGVYEEGEDGWFGYPEDRAELSEYISTTFSTAQNLLMVSSDAHMVAFDDGSNTYYGTDTDGVASFPILQSGPLDRLGSAKGGPFTDGCHTIQYERNHQYSTIEFQTTTEDGQEQEPCMEIKSYDSSGTTILSKQLCGQIFASSANAGTGSCNIDTFSTRSTVLISLSVVFLFLIFIATCCFLGNKCLAINIFMVVLVFLVATVAVGFGIPLAAGYSQFDTFVVLLIALLQMIAAFIYVGCWIWKTRKQSQTNDGEDEGDV